MNRVVLVSAHTARLTGAAATASTASLEDAADEWHSAEGWDKPHPREDGKDRHTLSR